MNPFIIGIVFGIIGTLLSIEGVKQFKHRNLQRKKEFEDYQRIVNEHDAAMQALRILKAKIQISHDKNTEHIISKYEKNVIINALNGIYTIQGL